MWIRTLALPLLFLSFSVAAQEPSPCALAVPAVLSANSEVPSQATCPCRITAFEATVYNRWASELWSTKKLEGFPGEMLAMKELQAGTYFWNVKYTAILNGEPTESEVTGYINVLK